MKLFTVFTVEETKGARFMSGCLENQRIAAHASVLQNRVQSTEHSRAAGIARIAGSRPPSQNGIGRIAEHVPIA